MARPQTAPTGRFWAGYEHDTIRNTMDWAVADVAELLGRSKKSVEQARTREKNGRQKKPAEIPPVRPPGSSEECLDCWLVDDWECMAIWLKWNGYDSYYEVSRDKFGYVTLICTTKE